jgi:hypothetical protein
VGETRMDFCQKCLTHGAASIQAMGITQGITYRVRTAIDRAQTSQEIEALLEKVEVELRTALAPGVLHYHSFQTVEKPT